ncbi:hypothetical protein DL96DRAFT_1618534 [Flagelloscypha sp. PMI_526]|nr:hypothetical protein DL96DRAFT_1618534 [Flagelloscypha sp. PMI_526]
MASTVSFPSTSSPEQLSPQVQPPTRHLPFRRISLPTAPTLIHRPVSVGSFPEEETESSSSSSTPLQPHRLSVEAPRQRPESVAVPRSKLNKIAVSFKASSSVDEQKLAKRNKIIDEFYDTEKVYVTGLDLIYEKFLTPILDSLNTSTPLLNRGDLTNIFSNFIDIWNLHRAFLGSLTDLLSSGDHPPLSPPLASHFPYLSLYTPFITSFPATIQTLQLLLIPASPQYSPTFANFVAKQEKDPKLGKLKLRDWLLTVVQRCPRYLLLLKDLEGVETDDSERSKVREVRALVEKITSSLNTSLSAHLTTLSLLSLQRNTSGLPFPLITPGRTLIKRETLYQVERGEVAKERDFLLFSDCLVWIASEESEAARHWWQPSSSQLPEKRHSAHHSSSRSRERRESRERTEALKRPGMGPRTRSKSEAGLSELVAREATVIASGSSLEPPATPSARPFSRHKRQSFVSSPTSVPKSPQKKKLSRQSSSGANATEEKWAFKGRMMLMDVDVVVLRPVSYHSDGEDEIGDSSSDEEDEAESRKFELHSPSGSFVVYANTPKERDLWVDAIREAKQEWMGSLNVGRSGTGRSSGTQGSVNGTGRGGKKRMMALPFKPGDERIGTLTKSSIPSTPGIEKRSKVDHFVPPIWIPDSRTSECMRCGRSFGWRRRRHHCRLCGRCVCGSCSERTFYLSDGGKNKEKPSRACDACYEAVFPIVPTSPTSDDASFSEERNQGTIGTLTNFPNWLSSMPSLPMTSSTPNTPSALMRIDSTPLVLSPAEDDELADALVDGRQRIRKPRSRPRSYIQILEDFNRPPSEVILNSDDEDEDGVFEEDEEDLPSAPASPSKPSNFPPRSRRSSSRVSFVRKKEDTVRKKKRFSLPAVAVHTASVTTSSSIQHQHAPSAYRREKRFSLVLGRSHFASGDSVLSGLSDGIAGGDLANGVAAGKLNELLGRTNSQKGEENLSS